MPIATMKKNDPNCPINFNDPSGEARREGQPLPCKQTSDGSAYLERRRPILEEHEGWMMSTVSRFFTKMGGFD